MRPLRMEVKGFTAFRDQVEIDFTPLDVFAVSGATGSGKSSLLDAMTYALYGRVERVGDRVSQLISQGQPRMTVTLEFEVDRDRYRVTRSTPTKGGTKILLERQQADGRWRQAGDGSDRVREAEPMIARIIGLTYDGFTRSILLPQGKFSEFLVGDAKKRRDILVELLGLSLFRRMAERAGASGKEASDKAKWTSELLDREYGDATASALKDARTAAREARRREEALGHAAQRVLEVLGRWQDIERSRDALGACQQEAAVASEDAAEAARELSRIVGRLEDVRTGHGERAAQSEAEHRALDQARSELLDAERALGHPDVLAEARVAGLALAEARRTRDALTGRAADTADAAQSIRVRLEEAERWMAERLQAVAAGKATVRAAEMVLEKARHSDLVAAVSAGVKIGDLCPVCARPLQRAPKKRPGGSLEAAKAGVQDARLALEASQREGLESERMVDRLRGEAQSNTAEQDRLAGELWDLDQQMAVHREGLVELLGDPLPEDPAQAILERQGEVRRLDEAERDAQERAAQAALALLRAQGDLQEVAHLIERQRDRLARDHGALFDRAARALGRSTSPVRLPRPPAADDPAGLVTFAESLAAVLSTFAGRLEREVKDRTSRERTLLAEAQDAAGDLVDPSSTLKELAGTVNDACRTATRDVAMSQGHATGLAERVERKKELTAEVEQLERRTRVFRQLALELRADRLIAFLQAEALQVLAAAGSERLSALSAGRYRLVFRDDEFFVLDTWNGEEQRSVRTLSGGETFLASLALALALADQVRSLSSTDRARLDSLFLDEGFGTLDQETLRVVVDAIEQLGGDGRLIGVVTHVRELAEQFPRVEIEKWSRGSRLSVVAA